MGHVSLLKKQIQNFQYMAPCEGYGHHQRRPPIKSTGQGISLLEKSIQKLQYMALFTIGKKKKSVILHGDVGVFLVQKSDISLVL